jgi:hypothetical protein
MTAGAEAALDAAGYIAFWRPRMTAANARAVLYVACGSTG